MQLLSRYKMED